MSVVYTAPKINRELKNNKNLFQVVIGNEVIDLIKSNLSNKKFTLSIRNVFTFSSDSLLDVTKELNKLISDKEYENFITSLNF